MLENFIYAKEKSSFEEELNNGEVLYEAIVFIEDTKEIWTHGSYFSNIDDVLKVTEQSLTEEQKAQVKANLGIVESEIIEDAPNDGRPYGRILGDWGIIKQDTLETYDVSSDGQIFNFTKNLEKGIVQYAEIYNPLGTEVTIYIKRDTDTRKVEVKIAPGATVLFRIISGIKGFYLEKVYYSSL